MAGASGERTTTPPSFSFPYVSVSARSKTARAISDASRGCRCCRVSHRLHRNARFSPSSIPPSWFRIERCEDLVDAWAHNLARVARSGRIDVNSSFVHLAVTICIRVLEVNCRRKADLRSVGT
jgi:hypothetical protein